MSIYNNNNNFTEQHIQNEKIKKYTYIITIIIINKYILLLLSLLLNETNKERNTLLE